MIFTSGTVNFSGHIAVRTDEKNPNTANFLDEFHELEIKTTEDLLYSTSNGRLTVSPKNRQLDKDIINLAKKYNLDYEFKNRKFRGNMENWLWFHDRMKKYALNETYHSPILRKFNNFLQEHLPAL